MKRYLLLFLSSWQASCLPSKISPSMASTKPSSSIRCQGFAWVLFQRQLFLPNGLSQFRFWHEVCELPKYQNDQSQLVHHLHAQNLGVGWKELFVAYEKDAWMLRGGTMYETFGSLVFRS